MASLVFDLASHLVPADSPALARGARWLIAIGVLGAAAAALFGFLDLFAIPTGTPAFRTGLVHMGLNLTVTVTFLVNFLLRSGQAPVLAGPIVLSAASIAVLGVSGFPGGKLAYHYGIRVADEETQSAGFTTNGKG